MAPSSAPDIDADPTDDPSTRICVRSLSYKFPNGTAGLRDISLDLPAGSRTLLMGANGAGKTTLLRLLSGARLAPSDAIAICGRDPFKESVEGITYLGSEWASNPIVRRDVFAAELLDGVSPASAAWRDAYPLSLDDPAQDAGADDEDPRSRRRTLLHMLEVDERWRMHAVSDGQRRRVQLAMGLLRPWRVLLLDEVTADLDVLARRELLAFLRRETARRGCAVVYATHVLDGLEDWATHWVRLVEGECRGSGRVKELRGMAREKMEVGWLTEVVVGWLRGEREERRKAGKAVADGEQTHEAGVYNEGLGGYGMEKSKRS